ncbi:MAG: phosphoribosylanthranilate isomerase, partial [Acidobacteriaceae bacterium]
MWIKLCANTTLEDAQLASDAGADAIGFVFAPSPRRVTAGQIAEIMPNLPPDLTRIGVFNTQDFDEIVFSLNTSGLHGVQLHGELDFALAEKLRNQFGPGFFMIQTLHWNLNSDPTRAEQKLRDELRA